jgi:hypothetical protein
MHAGSLDRTIIIQRASGIQRNGASATSAWEPLGELRAELVNLAAVSSGVQFGAVETTGILFRTRYMPGLSTADRIVFDGACYKIMSIAEIGRRRGLEIKVERQK